MGGGTWNGRVGAVQQSLRRGRRGGIGAQGSGGGVGQRAKMGKRDTRQTRVGGGGDRACVWQRRCWLAGAAWLLRLGANVRARRRLRWCAHQAKRVSVSGAGVGEGARVWHARRATQWKREARNQGGKEGRAQRRV